MQWFRAKTPATPTTTQEHHQSSSSSSSSSSPSSSSFRPSSSKSSKSILRGQDESTPLLSGGTTATAAAAAAAVAVETAGDAPLVVGGNGSLLASGGARRKHEGQPGYGTETSSRDSEEEEEEEEEEYEDDRPLPTAQLFLVCYARFVEPLAFFCIFPFINKMIMDTGDVKEEDLGFYSGLIESLFSFTQMLVMIPWGRAADRVGRKPVLLFSMTGIALSISIFGMAKSFWQMVLFRCMAGIFGGVIVTVRAMISEMSTPKTQARAFSWFSTSSNIGIMVGPLIGGALSNPAEQLPSVFGNSRFLKDHPYCLPGFVIGGIAWTALLANASFTKETLKRKSSGSSSFSKPMSMWEVLCAPGVGMVLFLYFWTMVIALSFTAVFPVFLFTRPELGGYGFSPLQISLYMALVGISQTLWVLLVFPPLQRRYSTGAVFRACGLFWPLVFILYPFASLLLRSGFVRAFWVVALLNAVLGGGVAMAYTCSTLTLNDISPSPATLGTLNAIALSLGSGIRAFAPAAFASFYAVGVRGHLLGGYLVWLVFFVLVVGFAVAVRWLPPGAEGDVKVLAERKKRGDSCR
ncbi:major facilitator superfamily domain-containing protein [Phyllosticta citriasiana]|uniref:Major facilitator superfamily domain-containing protein n=1 Tax=Phyllosticta citriasiana TaxID=595635 RepID=A0ABR1KES3_9PEZI